MNAVTIVGRIETTHLKRGERATVERTPLIDALIAKGFVIEEPDTLTGVVEPPEAPLDAPETASEPEEAPVGAEDSPARSASKREWQEFLDEQGVEYDPEATRTALIEVWDGRGTR